MKVWKFLSLRYLLVLIGIGVVTFATLVVLFAALPHRSEIAGPKKLIVKNGDGLTIIASKLKQQDLIRSKYFFKWFSIAMGNITAYKRGEYLIENDVSVLDLVTLLKEGRTILLSVTFPEGLRMQEMFLILIEKGFENQKQYLKLSHDIGFIKSLGKPILGNTLEGFLFPDTYQFSKDATESIILTKMVNTFFEKLPVDFAEQAQKVGLTFYEAVVLASIIEKETGVPSERNLIASVFHNRLKKKMLLQTDPTVIYGIKNFDGNLTKKHLKTWSPYNTYINYGLPPTPIANPGMDALLAAVSPSKSDYIYFVAKGDGTHVFSTNYKAHKIAVAKFQRRHNSTYRSY